METLSGPNTIIYVNEPRNMFNILGECSEKGELNLNLNKLFSNTGNGWLNSILLEKKNNSKIF